MSFIDKKYIVGPNLRIEKQKSLLAEAKVPQRNVAWKDYKKTEL